MTEEKFIIEDDSGDRNYFTIIPNYILNHSTSDDQSLYLQMKRFAGEKNECFASEVLLRKKMKIGRNALKKSIQYLLEHGWIKEKGFKEVPTKGGLQKIKVYSINNIWKINNNFYKGCAETTGVSGITTLNEVKGCAETTSRVGQNDIQGWAGMTTNKNKENKNQEEDTAETAEWDFKKYLEGMEESKRRDLPIIALYWKFKKFAFTNKKQAEVEIKRSLRAAKELEPFEDEKIWKTMDWLSKNADFKWVLESVSKYVAEDLSKLKIKR